MDESWLEEVEALKEQEWDFPDEPIEDPYVLLEAFNTFHATVRRRIAQAQDDLNILIETRDRHKADFAMLSDERRDKKYEEKVRKKDQAAIDAKKEEIVSMEKDRSDMDDRILRLEVEIKEQQDKKAAQKRGLTGAQGAPDTKRMKDISPGRAAKVLEMANKLKDVSTMAALRTIIDECAVLARDEELEVSGESPDDAHMHTPEELDLPEDTDVAGLSMLEQIATYSEDEKERWSEMTIRRVTRVA